MLFIASSKNHDFLTSIVENAKWSYQVSLVILLLILLVDFIIVLLLNDGQQILFSHWIPKVLWNLVYDLGFNIFVL